MALSRKFKVSIAAAALLTFGRAYAADLPANPAYRAPTLPAVAVYNWTGIYIGGNAGYGFGQQTPLSLFSSDFEGFNYNANGWLAGLTLGAQIQSGHVVLGLEGDIDWTGIKGSGTGPVTLNNAVIGTATLSSTVSSISTLRTRVGYASDNWLFFGTGGLAATNRRLMHDPSFRLQVSSGFIPRIAS